MDELLNEWSNGRTEKLTLFFINDNIIINYSLIYY